MRDQILENRINYNLKRTYGSDKLNGRQSFRIVWSSDELEYRKIYFKGEFELSNPVIEQVPKYQWDPCYVLERSTDIIVHPDVQNHNGYECIYRLPDDKPLNEKAVNLLLFWLLNGQLPAGKKLTDYTEEHEAEERKKNFEEEVAYFQDYFMQKGGDMGISYGEAVSYSGLDAKEALNG